MSEQQQEVTELDPAAFKGSSDGGQEPLGPLDDPFATEPIGDEAESIQGDPGDEQDGKEQPEEGSDEQKIPGEKKGSEKSEEGQEDADSGVVKIGTGDSAKDFNLSTEIDLGLGEKLTLKEIKARIKKENTIRADMGRLGDEKTRFEQEKEQLLATKAELDSQLKTTHEFLSNLNQSIDSGNPVDVVNQIVEMAGGHGPSFWGSLFSKIAPEAAEFLELDEDARNEVLRKHQIEAREQKLNKQEEGQKRLREQQQDVQYTRGLLNQWGLTDQHYNEALSDLKNLYEKNPGQFANIEKMSKQEKIQQVVGHAVDRAWFSRLESAYKNSDIQFGDLLQKSAQEVYKAVMKYPPKDIDDEVLGELISTWAEDNGLKSAVAKPDNSGVDATEAKPKPKTEPEVSLPEAEDLEEDEYQGIQELESFDF